MSFTPLNDVGFPEFTTKLIKDTFDTLISANINQMHSFSELLSETAKTITQYTNDNYQSVTSEEVLDFLATIPLTNTLGIRDEVLLKVNELAETKYLNNAATFVSGVGSASDSKVNLIKFGTTSGLTLEKPALILFNTLKKNSIELDVDGASDNAAVLVSELFKAVAKFLTVSKYNVLQSLVKMGLLRLVVTRGEIEAKLDYKTFQSAYAASVESNSTVKALNAGIGGSYRNSTMVKGVGKLFQIAGSVNYSNVRVGTSSSSSSASAAQSIGVMGRVLLEFKTDYQPLEN